MTPSQTLDVAELQKILFIALFAIWYLAGAHPCGTNIFVIRCAFLFLLFLLFFFAISSWLSLSSSRLTTCAAFNRCEEDDFDLKISAALLG